MTLDLDTFLVALYSIVDDLYREHFGPHKPRRRGAKPRLSDSEVLTLVICAQWSGLAERKVIRYAQRYFPNLLSQSATNRRARDLAGVFVHLVPLVAAQLEAQMPLYQAIDGVPVPLMRACRGLKHLVFAEEANFGKGGSDRQWYYGCNLVIAVSSSGPITGFVLGPAGTQERWLAEYLFCWRADPWEMPWTAEDVPPRKNRFGRDKYVGPKGPIWPREGVGAPSSVIYLADRNFSGANWIEHWAADYGALVLTPESYVGEEAERQRRQHSGFRQVVDTVNGHLEQVLHLPFPGARSTWGLLTRVAAKLAAFNLGIWLNRLFGRPDLAHATLFDY